MIARFGQSLSQLARRYVPDPFVLAIGLTALVFVLALPRLGWSPMAVVDVWVDGAGTNKGFWNLLKFGMQMCLILVTGFALADTPSVRKGIEALARIPKTTGSAAALVSVVAMLFAYLNWGLGLIVGALLARQVGRLALEEGRPLHYPIVCAAGYTGLAVWHGGFSGSAPLKATSAEQLTNILGPDLASQVEPMLLSDTIGSPLNLLVTACCMVGIPLTLYLLTPKDIANFEAAPETLVSSTPEDEQSEGEGTFAERLNQSFIIALIPALMGLVWFVAWLSRVGLAKLNPDVINLFMLAVGLLLHGSVKAYVSSVSRAVTGCAGIILQFPFYAGIMGIMAGSGLIAAIGGWLSGLDPVGLTISTFYSGGLVNLVVPSGGGQWAVQGPIVMQAALDAGAEPATILMALAYGDQWTNLIQPFWALPLLGLCQVRVSAIIGYTAVLLLVSQLFFLIPLLIMV